MKTLEYFSAMSEQKLIDVIKSASNKSSSIHIELGKAIFTLDSQRQGKGTLKKYVLAKAGLVVPDHAFSCANTCNLVGVGYGHISEEIYDGTPLRWMLQVSAILNLIEKREFDDSTRMQHRESVAEILREKYTKGYDLLKEIKDALCQREPEEPAGGEGDEQGDDSALPMVDLLSPEHLKAIGRAAAECDDIAKLELARRILTSLDAVMESKLQAISETRSALPVAA